MKKKLIISIGLIILLVCYLVIGDYFQLFLFCPIKKFLGLYCPGCGVTRMLLSMLKGNFYQAFRYNPLLFLGLPFFSFYYCYYLYCFFAARKNKFSSLEPGIWYFLITIFVVYGVLRNISFFDFLQPTIVS